MLTIPPIRRLFNVAGAILLIALIISELYAAGHVIGESL